MSYFPSTTISGSVAIKQDVIADSLNSFSGSLAASGSWVGTGVSTLGVAGLQISMVSDKNCTLYVDQSPDNTNWDISDSYQYHTNNPSFGITVQAVSSYYRVTVLNTSIETATIIRMQSALCPIVEAVPRSLTSSGNLKVAIEEMTDNYGFGVENTPNDEMRVVTPYRLVGSIFTGSALDTNFWTERNSTNGSVVIGNGQAILTTAGSTSGSSSIQSIRSARYIGGSANRARMVVRMPDTGVAGNTRRWGAFNTTDGAFYEISGSTPKVVTRKTGVDSPVENGSFNGDYGTTVNLNDFTTVKNYEIYWNNSKVYFAIAGKLVHTVSAATTTWSDTVTLPLRFENVNSSGSTNQVTLNVRNAVIHRLGNALSQTTSYYFASAQTAGVNLKLGAGNLHAIVVNSVANTSVITLADSTSALTPVITALTANNATTTPYTIDFKGMPFFNGLRLGVTTANASLTVIYE
jgi:hypothetical protein